MAGDPTDHRLSWIQPRSGPGSRRSRDRAPEARARRSTGPAAAGHTAGMAPVDAVVIGSGPNGLGAAATLALAGRSVMVYEGADHLGGGLVTRSLGEPGWFHDLCAAVHPLSAGSPFLRHLIDQGLLSHDLWGYAEVEYAHPLDHGDAAVALADLDDTAAGLGPGRRAYRRLLEPLSRDMDAVLVDVLRPIVGRPRHLGPLVSLGLRAPWPFTWLARTLPGARAKALLAGCAAHSIMALNRPGTSAIGLVLAAAAHHRRWPLVLGGSGRLARELARVVTDHGGSIELGRRVRSLDELPRHRVALLDTNPAQVASIAGDRLSGRDRRRLTTFRHGAGSFKIDYTLDGPVPWTNPDCRRALTLHVGGDAAEVVAAEAEVAAGRHPDRPFVLVVQPSVVDATRAPSGRHVLWAYCHVPARSTVDMTDAIEAQIERFAPGFRDLIRTRTTADTVDLAARNPNYVGGDIAGGAMTTTGLVFRPGPRLHPYDTSNPGVLLCSASAPPGAGAHAMAGHLAARRALGTVLA